MNSAGGTRDRLSLPCVSSANEQRSVDGLSVPVRTDELQEPRAGVLLYQLPEADEVRGRADPGGNLLGLAVVRRVDERRELLIDVDEDVGVFERSDKDHQPHIRGVVSFGALGIEDDDVHHLPLSVGAVFDLERTLSGALCPVDHLEQSETSRDLGVGGHLFDDKPRTVHGSWEIFILRLWPAWIMIIVLPKDRRAPR